MQTPSIPYSPSLKWLFEVYPLWKQEEFFQNSCFADSCHSPNAFLNCVDYKKCILIAQS